MGERPEVWAGADGIVCQERFGCKDVQAGAEEAVVFKAVDERLFVDGVSPADVDDGCVAGEKDDAVGA